MDLPAQTAEWLIDEIGDEYRVNAAGEREYRVLRPGENPEYDAWFIAEVEHALREADDPNAVWIDNDEVERDRKSVV